MKYLLLLIIIFSFSIQSKGQNVPNGDFENWTSYGSGIDIYEKPDYWQTTDSFSILQGMHSVTKDSLAADVHSGSYAMRLTPFTYAIFTIPGVASNGTINPTTLTIIGGTPDTVRHAMLSGWY